MIDEPAPIVRDESPWWLAQRKPKQKPCQETISFAVLDVLWIDDRPWFRGPGKKCRNESGNSTKMSRGAGLALRAAGARPSAGRAIQGKMA